ncbi:hypothetical protein ACHAXM_000523 [Skeletonema potamos]|jgi:21S rRNA (GM2251-2'-O)-methyltransferase
MNCIVTMLTAMTITLHFLASRSSVLVRAWSSSSFVPTTSSRQALLSGSSPIRNDVQRGTRQNLKSTLVMWGEEDAPSSYKEIPSSKSFSSDTQQRRPARRSRRSSSGWDDDGNTKNDGWEEEYNPRPQRQPQRWINSRDSGSGRDDGGGYDRVSNKGGRLSASSGWDVDQNDARGYNSFEPYTYDNLPSRNRGRGAGGGESYRRGGERGGRARGGRGRGGRADRGRGTNDTLRRGRGSDIDTKPGSIKINLKLIENAGYEHLYGISPVLNALKAKERNFANPDDEEKEDLNDLLDLQERLSTVDGIDDEFSRALEDEFEFDEKKEVKREIKPEAKLAPYLFVQVGTLDNTKRSFRSDAKIKASSEIVALAKEYGLPIAEVDKGVLNTLCGSRPHQGFVLRCGGLNFEPMRSIPAAVGDDSKSNPLVWLALDEVVDPQNLGALLRSVFFLGSGGRVGVIVTAKNSSPLSPAVSAASSGALEFMTVYSTSNLPKLLNNAKDDGWRVLGAAAEVPETTDKKSEDIGADENDWDVGGEDNGAKQQQHELQQQCYDLYNVETNKPTIIVLGSEGKGLRTLVGRACTSFVKIPGGPKITADEDADSQAGVDSLNVSVTGGILLWHFLSGSRS